jgi:ATP-dependent DNA helicase DinG
MTVAAEVLASRLPWPVLVQGELPKAALLEALSSQSAACLCATMSFWQGVDVPGPALSLVVIDRIPFPRPDDPLMAARREAAGRSGFQTSRGLRPCSPRVQAVSSGLPPTGE